ncbi:hypothetical protein GCM10010174_04210 [Kutzneria viridogrisea]
MLVACAAVGALLAGCGAGPSQLGAAAIIGDHVVGIDQVQQQISAELANVPQARQLQQQGKFDQVARTIVSYAIFHELATQLATEQGIHVDQQLVDRITEQSLAAQSSGAQDGSVAPERGLLRQSVWDNQVFSAIGGKLAPRLSITVDTAVVSDKSVAVAKAKEIADNPQRADEIIKSLGANSKTNLVNKTLQLDTASQLASLFVVPQGSVVAYQFDNSGASWLVGYVKKRDTSASPVDMDSVDPQLIPAIGKGAAAVTAVQRGLKVNPRYGVWDPLALSLAPSTGEAVGVTLTAKTQNPNQ